MGRATIIFIAVTNVVLAVFFMGCGACANYWDQRQPWHVDVNNQRVADEEMLQAHLRKTVPGYPTVKITSIVLGYAVGVGLILSALALFGGRGWGKYAAAAIFALAFLHHLISLTYQLVWLNPAIETFFAQVPRPAIINDAADLMIKTQSYSARVPGYLSITWWIIGCLYYLIATPAVLFISTTPAAARADKASRKKKRHDEDEVDRADEDDEDERPRRRKQREGR